MSLSSVGSALSARSRRYSEVELGESVLDSSQLMLARAAISFFAVLMLWMSSAVAVRGMLYQSDLLPYTSPQGVVSGVALLINETRRMREDYATCVKDKLQVCNTTLEYHVNAEVARSAQARRANADRKNRAQVTSSQCVKARTTAYAAVSTWQSQVNLSAPGASHYLPTCTANEQATLQALTGDTSAQRSASMQLVNGYSSTSQSTVGLLGGQLSDRAAYDAEYLRNRTIGDAELNVGINVTLAGWSNRFSGYLNGVNVNVSAMLACTSFAQGGCPYGVGAADLVRNTQEHLVREYSSSVDKFNRAKHEFEGYMNESKRQLEEGAAKFLEIRDRVQSWASGRGLATGNIWNDIFPGTGFSAPSLGISVGSAHYPSNIRTPELNMHGVYSVDDLSAFAQTYHDQYRDSVTQAYERAEEELDALVPAIRANLTIGLGSCGGIPCDYNPPPIDPDTAVQEHSQKSDEFERDMAVTLDAFDESRNANANASATDYRPLFSTNVSASDLVRSAVNTKWLNYETFQDAGIQMDEMLAWFSRIWALFETFDTIWRVLQTVRILRRFWGRSALSVAPIDMTTDADSKSRATAKISNPMVTAATFLSHPIVIAAVVVIFAFVIGSVLLSFYMIPFGLYVDHCTASCRKPGGVCDGTFIARNAYSLAYNFATNEGNSLRLSGIDEYEIRRAEYCASHGERSVQDEQRTREDYSAIAESHCRAQAEVALMDKCYDTAVIDADFRAGLVLDVNGAPFAPVATILAEPACEQALCNATLDEDGTFNCDVLPECELHCDDLTDNEGNQGSGAIELFTLSRSSMCTAQHWAHSIVVRNAFVFVIWVFVNIGRIILLAGVVRVSWESLNSGYFAYLGTCKHDGTHTHEHEELADKVHTMLVNMRLVGAVLVVIALLPQAAWMVSLAHFSAGLKQSLA